MFLPASTSLPFVISDSGPQCYARKLPSFAMNYIFPYVTRRPRYPQANWVPERMVATMKGMFAKTGGPLSGVPKLSRHPASADTTSFSCSWDGPFKRGFHNSRTPCSHTVHPRPAFATRMHESDAVWVGSSKGATQLASFVHFLLGKMCRFAKSPLLLKPHVGRDARGHLFCRQNRQLTSTPSSHTQKRFTYSIPSS